MDIKMQSACVGPGGWVRLASCKLNMGRWMGVMVEDADIKKFKVRLGRHWQQDTLGNPNVNGETDPWKNKTSNIYILFLSHFFTIIKLTCWKHPGSDHLDKGKGDQDGVIAQLVKKSSLFGGESGLRTVWNSE
jgi:hypothetical protein